MSENTPAQASDEPMPCPFCGFDEVDIESYSVMPDNFHSAYVQCNKCDARGPNALTVDGWLPNKEEAVAEAIKAWNALATPRATADVVQDAERLMFVMQDIDGFGGVALDKYDYAMRIMEQRGHDEPTAEDELDGVRTLIDAAIAATKGAKP